MRTQWNILINHRKETVFTCVISVEFLQQWVAPPHIEKYNIPPESHYRKVYHSHVTPELQQVSEGPFGVGTTFKQQIHSLEALLEITGYEPPTSFALKVTSPATTSQEKWTFQQVGDATRVTMVKEEKLQGKWSLQLLRLTLGVIAAIIMRPHLALGSKEIQKYIEDHCQQN